MKITTIILRLLIPIFFTFAATTLLTVVFVSDEFTVDQLTLLTMFGLFNTFCAIVVTAYNVIDLNQ